MGTGGAVGDGVGVTVGTAVGVAVGNGVAKSGVGVLNPVALTPASESPVPGRTPQPAATSAQVRTTGSQRRIKVSVLLAEFEQFAARV